MGKFGPSVACLVVLLLFLAPREVRCAGRRCESPSQGFSGICTTDHNCAVVCRSEGFGDGLCRAMIGAPAGRGCICLKPC